MYFLRIDPAKILYIYTTLLVDRIVPVNGALMSRDLIVILYTRAIESSNGRGHGIVHYSRARASPLYLLRSLAGQLHLSTLPSAQAYMYVADMHPCLHCWAYNVPFHSLLSTKNTKVVTSLHIA